MMKKNDTHISKLKKLLSWLDDKILLLLSAFLLVFIPLYPKIPLMELIPGYIVRMRLEDIFIAMTAGVWFIQLLRKKAKLRSPITILVGLYLLFTLLTMVFAVYWTHSVPPSYDHILKMALHWARRIEYFSLFFVVFSAIKSKSDVLLLLKVFVISSFLVSVYGMGQKYLYWPVYSTMNREFSKGVRLILTKHARVQSTFGGHYDFAAYLVILLPLVLGLAFYSHAKKTKTILWVIFATGLWGMMMTSSRSSFLAYLLAITLMMFFLMWQKGFLWFISRLFIVYVMSFSFMFIFGDLSERFAQVFQGSSSYDAIAGIMNNMKEQVQQPMINAPANGVAVDDADAVAKAAEEREKQIKIILDSDQRPVADPNASLPPDVFVDVPDKVIATRSAEGKDIQVVIPRVFSENAHKLGLSAAIRLDTLWPFAIKGFLRNPLFGSGYGTLNKYTWGQFTEAESTDNDFLRTLGETGLLGFLTFYGSMITAMVFSVRISRKSKDPMLKLLVAVLISVTMGLFVNAVYIDVFVASKVIQTYWSFVGIVIAYSILVKKKYEKNS